MMIVSEVFASEIEKYSSVVKNSKMECYNISKKEKF